MLDFYLKDLNLGSVIDMAIRLRREDVPSNIECPLLSFDNALLTDGENYVGKL